MLRRFYSLKNSLALHFALLALVPLFAISALADVMFSNKLRQRSIDTLYFLAVDIRDETQNFLVQPLNDLEYLRRILDIPGAGWGHKVDTLLQETVNAAPYFRSLYLLDQNGKVTNLGVKNKNSALVDDYRGIDLSGLSLVKNESTMSSSRATWSDVFLDIQDGGQTIAICVPSGQGTLAGFVSLEAVNAILARISRSYPGDMAIVDDKGILLAQSPAVADRQPFNFLRHPEVMEVLREKTEIRTRLHEDDRTFESVSYVPETGWAIYVSRDRDEIFAPIFQLRQVMTVLVGVVAVASVLFGLFFSRWLSEPIALLAAHANRLADGGSDFPQLPPSYNELNELTEDFRAMATAVREREMSLEKSRQRYQSLVESLDGIVWELRLDEFIFTYVSQQAVEILGYSIEDWYEVDFWKNAIFSEDREWVVDYCKVHAAKGLDHDFDYRMLAADGRVVWIRDLVTVVKEEGRPVQLRGVMLDITRQKEAELLLQESEQRFRSYFELGLIGMALTGPDKEWIQVNSTLCQMLGYSEDELLRKTWVEVTVLEDVEQELIDFARLQSGEIDGYRIDKGFVRKDGELVETSLSVHALRNTDGSINHCIVLIQDISERQKLQQQNVRTAQLASLGELAAGVAHEINNPINGVINYAQILANRLPAETQDQDLVGRIIKEGDRIAGIVRNLLYFAREQKPRFAEVRLADLIEECLSLTRAQLAKEGTMLKLEIDDDLPPIQAQSQQLQQLLLNLISNARYALNQKYPERDDHKVLELGASYDGERGVVRILCRDHGVGISESLLAKVMNPFMTTKPAGVGTGLGLSISREIVEKHGGSLGLESVEGEQTCVTVELPLTARDEA